MDNHQLTKLSDFTWCIEPYGKMRVPVVIYADEFLIKELDSKVYQQAINVATLPGIVSACYTMPDAHWGYGFPIGGVAAFDAEQGGVVSAGGVGFDISCGVRTLQTGLTREAIEPIKVQLADALYRTIPVGVGSTGHVHLNSAGMDAMLAGGAQWAVERGYGIAEDLQRIEEFGCMAGAQPQHVSEHAKRRQRNEMGTLGSGNHYLEVQEITDIYDPSAATAFGITQGNVVVTIHCGSRGLGHQIGTEFLREMVVKASYHGIQLPDRELACAPIASPLGQRYLGAVRSAINCALANRQIITHLTRQVFTDLLPSAELSLFYDVSHNTCKEEHHWVSGVRRKLYVHRKGATRAYGAEHPDLPAAFQQVGQPVLIGGSMGTASYILAGNRENHALSFSSACHGAGRHLSRRQASKTWKGQNVIAELAQLGIIIRSPSFRGIAEEAPGAYKDVNAVVGASEQAGLARKVAKLVPIVCIKG